MHMFAMAIFPNNLKPLLNLHTGISSL